MTPEQITAKKFDILIDELGAIVSKAQTETAKFVGQLNEFVSDPNKISHAHHAIEWMGGTAFALAGACHVVGAYSSLVVARSENRLTDIQTPEQIVKNIRDDLTSDLLKDRFRGGSSSVYKNALDCALRSSASGLVDVFSPFNSILVQLARVDEGVNKAEEVTANSGC